MNSLVSLESLCRTSAARLPGSLRGIMAALPILLVGLALSAGTQAAEPEPSTLRLGGDQYSVGDALVFTEAVTGDLFAAGSTLTVNADVGGMVVAAGGEITLGRRIQGSTFAAGRKISLTGSIGSNARMAASELTFGTQSAITGNATLAGDTLNLEGAIGGYVLAAGRRVYLNGRIGGDVMIAGENVELGPDAVIEGRLTYRANQFVRADSARVGGAVEALPVEERADARGISWVPLLIWSIGLAVVGALLITVAPARTLQASEMIRARLGTSLGYGLLAVIGIPFISVIALVTLIGIPLGLLLLLAYPILLILGYVQGGIALGDAGLRRFHSDTALAERNPRILGALLALVLLALVSLVPFIGVLACLVVLVAGLGALVHGMRKS